MSHKVLITDTILRDAHQSQAATRMRLDEMLPVCDKLDKVGYYSLECWGGATFDACLRFLNEDPVGPSASASQGIAQYEASDAAARTESAWIQALCR